jgi:hypothetical protein
MTPEEYARQQAVYGQQQLPQRNQYNQGSMANWGNRPDGSSKGTGWLGALNMQDGSNKLATEMTIGVSIDGREMNIPMLVPTLAKEEIDYLLKGGKPNKVIVDKAVKHAISRMQSQQSPYAD